MDTEHIAVKIGKLFNLANNDAASEGERDNAIRIAYALLKKYNLEMKDIKGQEEERVNIDYASKNDYEWFSVLVNSIAKMSFCFAYRLKGSRGLNSFHFIGKPLNVLSCLQLADYLNKSIRRECKNNKYKGSSATAFCRGASNALIRRMREMMHNEYEEKSSSGTSVVVFRQAIIDDNQAWCEKEFGMKFTVARIRNNYNLDSNAYHHGHSYGNSINLSKQIGGNKMREIER